MDHNWGRDSRNQWNLPTWLANNSRNKPPLTQDSLVDNLPVTTTNTNITPVITDPFDAPFGNKLQNLKPPNTFCIALQNFGGWPQLNNHTKMTTSASAAWTSNLMYWPLQKITLHGTKYWLWIDYPKEPVAGGMHATSTWLIIPNIPMPTHTSPVELPS